MTLKFNNEIIDLVADSGDGIIQLWRKYLIMAKINSLQDRFDRFHSNNPSVFKAWKRVARDFKASGEKVGSKTVGSIVREETGIGYDKSYDARYMRLLCETYKTYSKHFDIRSLRVH